MARMTLEELVAQLRSAYGPHLRSVVLYGSAAAGEHIPKRSDYNVLVIADDLGLSQLRAASPTARAWAEAGNPPPLTMTPSEWRSSAEVFPMEYADILERHRVLHGEAPFDGISVDPKNLRLQLEQESMGKLLKLRQGVLSAGTDPRKQLDLLAGSISTVMVIFRAVVRLHRGSVPADNVELAALVAGYAGFDPAAFQKVVRHVRGTAGQSLRPAEAGEVLAQYLAGMEALDAYLDRYES